jgi:transcription antitermination factor nusB
MIMINRELIRLKVVQLVYAFYQNDGKTLDVAEKELKFSLSKAYELYKYLLSMLVDLKAYGERRAESSAARAERLGTKIGGLSPDRQFADNKFLVQLADNKALGEYREKKQEWPEEPAFVKKLYTTMIESELYQNYLTKEDFSYEADRELIRKLYKTYVCNNEDFDSLLEEHSLYWNDDKEIVDSFVMKTIKRFKEDSTAEQELLPDYAAVEDKNFAGTLFVETLKRAQEVRQLIRENSKNWEFNRLAFMDVIIMQIALAEILTFPQIPLSVTFNEYLDIAKIYSTPKSAGYINGLLDHVVKSLKKKGELMK